VCTDKNDQMDVPSKGLRASLYVGLDDIILVLQQNRLQ